MLLRNNITEQNKSECRGTNTRILKAWIQDKRKYSASIWDLLLNILKSEETAKLNNIMKVKVDMEHELNLEEESNIWPYSADILLSNYDTEEK